MGGIRDGYPKLLPLLAGLLFAGLLAGCGPDAGEASRRHEPSQVLADNQAHLTSSINRYGPSVRIRSKTPWRIAFLMKNFAWASPYWRRTHEGAESGSKEMGTFVRVLGVDRFAIEQQIKQVDALIAEGRTDGIIIAPLDSNRLSPVVEKAVASGIPVLVYDTPLNADHILTFVGFDNFGAGRLLGRWMVEQLGGKGNLLILEGPPGNQNALDRRNGMIAGLSEGDINVLSMGTANWQRHQAEAITAEWLQRFQQVDAIMAADDVMALGAADAIAKAGRHNILVTGFDANADALLAIRTGRLHATIAQAPKQQARRAVQLMVRHLQSGVLFPPALLYDSIHLITSENVADYQ
ncbi:hypothetical protein GCM10011348_30930 [Marinobacterium nitratireducens]|uniref:Periplasmic binding protein domain-containing protein n=1 Tax=Marinobacterium nitratireducens TaxID=518897 RepID=A0A917ZJB3_9GAMM|nr:sugar ABC transporter substrate-binding protein [Marinobacterium nitratireducens]GGO84508.1 hypothetical protein GCM10011348_30930 [Marinobacterium nitratireducens]